MLVSLAPLEPDAALEDGEEAELEDDEAEARDVAAETARTARAAGLRAIKIADDHWRAAGPMQARPLRSPHPFFLVSVSDFKP